MEVNSAQPRNLIVSLHDVHPGSLSAIQELAAYCESLGIDRFSLLVIPNYHREGEFQTCAPLVEWLHARQRRGDEIVLHGYYHLRIQEDSAYRNWFWTRFYTQNEAEFLDLDIEAAMQYLRLAKSLFESAGFEPSGFVAPGWLISRGALRAVFVEGFRYTNVLRRIIKNDGSQIPAWTLCYSTRARWRREFSLIWNDWLWSRLCRREVVRLSLHPNDFKFSRVRAQVGRIITEALASGFKAVTYQEVALG